MFDHQAKLGLGGETLAGSAIVRHFLRRRSLNNDLSGLRLHYRIDAFGERFHLNLTADSSFIAPSYTVTHLGEEQSNDTDSQSTDPGDMRHCFFRGHVNAKSEYPAVFSLCTGLIGTFTTQHGEFFLEPLLNAKPASSEMRGTMREELESLRATVEHQRVLENNFTGPHPRSPRRRKRFLSYPRYVELMVTADAKMVRHHGRNLEHYILTIMSVVTAVYRDPSIGNLISIKIVKLEGPTVSFNAATTLHNFCVWQQSHNVQDDSHPSHHDTMFMRICVFSCVCVLVCVDPVGLAELGTMCDPYRSCSISEENGISASFTIAHELGHVFNMPHDDNPKCREAGIKHQYHVMAPTLNYDTNPWSWSKCSRKYITDFLDTGYGECLLDEPVGRTYDMPTLLPGQLYNANRQCELMFGPGSQICPYLKQCKRLWCTSAEGDHKGCRTQHMPLADGTDCGHGMYCRHGMCVNKDLDLQPVHGEWGPWGPYSVCSRSCGGGTRSTTRDCNKPEPRNGGKFCVGRRMKFRSCNTEPCPRGQKDFREEQCSQFDGKHFNINGLPPTVRWVPKYSGILMKDRCKLFCRVAGTTAYYQLKDRVIDGTPCGPDTYDICVQGLCRQAGCDHVLNSKARNDKCGVCGGDNSSCKTLEGTFNDAQYGYNTVVRIPAGAMNIDIKQVSYSGKPEDDNYLALSDSHSNFLLNGNFVVAMFKREIDFKGTVIDYSGSDTKVERINCTDLTFMLLLYQFCFDYLHTVCSSVNVSPHTASVFTSFLEKECNEYQRVVTETCDDHPCPKWIISEWSECSSTCAGGFQRRVVVCQDADGRSNNYCDERVKPAESKNCDSGPCPLWNYGVWGECTQTCGGGRRTRLVVCQRPNGQRLNDYNCDILDKPPDMEQCNLQSCPGSSSWHRDPWKPV
uniref:ADAM metallopeptidase with thrombospondin type 1 motif 20 n=1 Tax=Pundamilia nyererei TaxID=303518 RepID=A0A3B4FE41_9CICH